MSASSSAPQGTTIRDLSGLVAVLPTLLGFFPHRSLIVCCLRGQRVALTVRVDVDGANVAEVATTTIMAASRVQANELIVVGFLPHVSPVIHEVLKDLALTIENQTMDDPQPLTVRSLAAVGRKGWTELPMWGSHIPELRPLSELTEHPVHVERVFRGMAPAKSRRELVARVQAGSDVPDHAFVEGWNTQRDALNGMADHEMAAVLDGLLTAYEALPVGQLPEPSSMGAMAALVTQGDARDVASLRVSAETSHRWVDLWAAISRSTDGESAIVPLSLCALACWVRGDGALANAALDQAEAIADGLGTDRHPLTRIVRSVIVNAIPPEHWTVFAREMREAGLITPTTAPDEQRAS